MPEAVPVTMVTDGAEVEIQALGTFPADTMDGRSVAASTGHSFVFDPCEGVCVCVRVCVCVCVAAEYKSLLSR